MRSILVVIITAGLLLVSVVVGILILTDHAGDLGGMANDKGTEKNCELLSSRSDTITDPSECDSAEERYRQHCTSSPGLGGC